MNAYMNIYINVCLNIRLYKHLNIHLNKHSYIHSNIRSNIYSNKHSNKRSNEHSYKHSNVCMFKRPNAYLLRQSGLMNMPSTRTRLSSREIMANVATLDFQCLIFHPTGFMDYIIIEKAIFSAIVERITEYSARLEMVMTRPGCSSLGNWVDNERAQRLLHRGKRSLQTLRSSGKIGYTTIDGKVMYPLKEIERYLKQSYTKDG